MSASQTDLVVLPFENCFFKVCFMQTDDTVMIQSDTVMPAVSQYCTKEDNDITANYFMTKALCIRSRSIRTASSFCRWVQFVTVGYIHGRLLITHGKMK